MNVPVMAEQIKKQLREGPLNEILNQYTNFWEGEWGEGIPVKVTIHDWTFSKKGLVFYDVVTGLYVPWLETSLVNKLDFIERTHKSLVDAIRISLDDLDTKVNNIVAKHRKRTGVTCKLDIAAIAEDGTRIPAGTTVEYLSHLHGGAVQVNWNGVEYVIRSAALKELNKESSHVSDH